MKTMQDNKGIAKDSKLRVGQTKTEELLEIAVETIRRYATTLGTILVQNGGSLEFNPEHTKDISGSHVDFTVSLLDSGMILLSLLVDGEPWTNLHEVKEDVANHAI